MDDFERGRFKGVKNSKASIADIVSLLDVLYVTGKEGKAAVKQAVKNLLMTGLGQRPFNPNLGADLGSILFENATLATEQELELLITTAIENFEPRAQIVDIKINNELDRNQMFVSITFNVRSTREQVTLETSLSRLR